ncbi:hypothetical protein EPN96_03270 [bacterium]|nr:MAG: hypothetical protein EPN96_03270 [bacterium]
MKRWMMFLLTMLFFAGCGKDYPASLDGFWIKVSPMVTGPYTVDVDVTTNLPGEPVLSLGLDLADGPLGIAPGGGKVFVSDGKGRGTLDSSPSVTPLNEKIPSGKYKVTATYYPNWEENVKITGKEVAEKSINAVLTGKSIDVEGSGTVFLKGSGEKLEDAKRRWSGRQWVEDKVKFADYPWEPDLWKSKFGEWELLKTENGNPNIIKMYYFKVVDITLMVNVLKNEIATYRMGRSNK